MTTPRATLAFRKESQAIGAGPSEEDARRLRPPLYSLQDMLTGAVYISNGSQVALHADPRTAWSFADFERLTAASVHREDDGWGRASSVAKTWLRHAQRLTVITRTFKAGAPRFCQSPDDLPALNTWRESPRLPPPADWRQRAQPFFDHVGFLVPVEAEREFLLDWLAHIDQQPGVLPHVHVLMTTPRQGVGRNLLSGVLARVWPGVTALDLDLHRLLEGGFNGVLARRLLGVVNEVRGGGGFSSSYRHADKLRGLLTDEERHLDPKFGHQYTEFNAMRWLMFSNHENALPLDRFDRRIFAIRNPDEPRTPDYYRRLYALAADAQFIAAVREALRTRDIRKFNPGMPAPLTETKRQIIEASLSEAELEMQDVAANYPSDCITSDALGRKLYGADSGRKERASLRYVAPHEGAQKYPRKVRVQGIQQNVWILRNHELWAGADAAAIAKEVQRGEAAEAAAARSAA